MGVDLKDGVAVILKISHCRRGPWRITLLLMFGLVAVGISFYDLRLKFIDFIAEAVIDAVGHRDRLSTCSSTYLGLGACKLEILPVEEQAFEL